MEGWNGQVRKWPARIPQIPYIGSVDRTDKFYRALIDKDARFDGKVFVGVVSTGIYCRPVCPARVPLRKNVRFYATATAAHEAGFRPCRRCRPETSPGTPAWRGTSATVSRALRALHSWEGGARKGESLSALSTRLGVTDRHLRRLFRRHLGASPRSVLLARRLGVARRLVEETKLSFTDIALASGFSSIRRFNDAFKRCYGEPPTSTRKKGR